MATLQAWSSRYAIYRMRPAHLSNTGSYPTLLPTIHFVLSDPVSEDEIQKAHDNLTNAAGAIRALSSFAPDDLLYERAFLMKLINRLYEIEKLLPHLESVDRENYVSMLAHYDSVVEKKERLLVHVDTALQERFQVIAPDGNDRVLMKVLWGSTKGSAMWDSAKKMFEESKAIMKAKMEG